MRKFLKIKKFFQKICKKFQPLTPRTKKFPAAAENKKFPAAAAAEKDVGLHLCSGPNRTRFFSKRNSYV
jgi:hypothetical protein